MARYRLAANRPSVALEMRFEFRAEHALKLPNGSEEDRHFHDYLLIIRVEQPIDALGYTVEADMLGRVVHQFVVGELQGAWLHNIIEQPTMERLAVWAWERLAKHLPMLASVSVSEQQSHSATATYVPTDR